MRRLVRARLASCKGLGFIICDGNNSNEIEYPSYDEPRLRRR